MFSKKIADVKKSALKIQDAKKDLATRFKHLKIILENSDVAEAKGLFEANFSHIYHILYDSFVQAETNLRQRVHKAHKEELEQALWILEQVLSLLPELIHKRWQSHSLGCILSKLLHPGNSVRLRRQAVRYFLMWYQALNDDAPTHAHRMFAELVPGVNQIHQPEGSKPSTEGPVAPCDLQAVLPPSAGDRLPEGARPFLDALLDGMSGTAPRLDWHERALRPRCFHFLLEMFKLHYLPALFPRFDERTSLYRPNLELPARRRSEPDSELVLCRVAFVKWLAGYTHQSRRGSESVMKTVVGSEEEIEGHQSGDSALPPKRVPDDEASARLVRDVLYSSRANVDFVHEVYRQAFLLGFAHAAAVRKTIAAYKDLIQGAVPELPPYALEPADEPPRAEDERPARLRTDSYLGAIQRDDLFVRAGMQNVLLLFTTHAAHVFLLEVPGTLPGLLEEQTDACKRVLNIYRYMVMHTRMDSGTWEQLLLVLLQITSLVLGETPPKKKMTTLGGKLAPAIFQTLIVTWIKANLNVLISRDLWDRFLYVLTSLTNWEELITEWAKTMETLTRVLARHVYDLDLTDLPLERLSEQRGKRVRRPTRSSESGAGEPAPPTSRQDSAPEDEKPEQRTTSGGSGGALISRSFSETNLTLRRLKQRHNKQTKRRSVSLDNLRRCELESGSAERTRSPSPAPSSGVESASIKDAPIQLDVLEHGTIESGGERRGVVCGGSVRGWVPDGAVILWKRMLGALGDVNRLSEPRLHAQVFEHLVKLTDTLIRIKRNQGVSADNLTTPAPPELVPPLTLILPWCFGALGLPAAYEAGKLSALRLLCTIMLNTDDAQRRVYLPHFYRCLHVALTGNSRAALYTTLKHLGPHFLSLQLPGSSLLLLDLIQACNATLNSADYGASTPRTEAVSILGGLLALPDSLQSLSVLQPDNNLHVVTCPDLKEHVVSILLRAGRREPTAMARCVALSALGTFVYKELGKETFHPKLVDAMKVILLALKVNNKTIAQLASDTLFLVCDRAGALWSQHAQLAASVVRALCAALLLHAPLGSAACSDADRSLGSALLQCLGEWCARAGPARLQGPGLLLAVFDVLHQVASGKAVAAPEERGLTQPSEEFDPNILTEKNDGLLPAQDEPQRSPSRNLQCQRAIALCARAVLAHLVNHLGHFPMAIGGAARLSSLVVEQDDGPGHADFLDAPNVQLFVLARRVIASLVELPALRLPGGGATAGLATADRQVRVLLRDLSGKACWDASVLYRTPEQVASFQADLCNQPPLHSEPASLCSLAEAPTAQRAVLRQRPPAVLPEAANAAPDLDQLHDLLQYIGYTSPEVLETFERRLHEPPAPPVGPDLEHEAIAGVIGARNSELDHARHCLHCDSMRTQPTIRPVINNNENSHADNDSEKLQVSSRDGDTASSFQQCRLLFSQLGLAGWERRAHLHLLAKTERLSRELRNLDAQHCRETHKVAVVYVAPGQEDKASILANQGGSAAYEQFLAALAWEVELEGHTGFLGGLQRQGSTGLTAPYVATSLLEAIFHVATRMPGDTPEAVLNKTRHLGNDEVHVVWSEHYRDYRRDIIPTEFCDVLLAIYPLGNQLHRVTVTRRPEVPHFGVLFDEAIVESSSLAGLVRATVVCAGRAKRTTLPFYQQYYEERARSLETVVTKHRDSTTYEDFISRVYSPVPGSNSGSSYCSLNASANVNNSSLGSHGGAASNLANALIDAHGHLLHKSGRDKFRIAEASSRAVWFNSPDSLQQQQLPQIPSLEASSISPRPLKKLSTSLKNVPRRTFRPEAETPPDSPPAQLLRKK